MSNMCLLGFFNQIDLKLMKASLYDGLNLSFLLIVRPTVIFFPPNKPLWSYNSLWIKAKPFCSHHLNYPTSPSHLVFYISSLLCPLLPLYTFFSFKPLCVLCLNWASWKVSGCGFLEIWLWGSLFEAHTEPASPPTVCGWILRICKLVSRWCSRKLIFFFLVSLNSHDCDHKLSMKVLWKHEFCGCQSNSMQYLWFVIPVLFI